MANVCATQFTKTLDAKNLKYRITNGNDEDILIDFPYEGRNTRLIFSGENGKYLSLYLVFEHIPEEKVGDVIYTCNELNCQYKWVTFYVDKDNDVILHDDAILSIPTAAEETFELLVRMLKIGDEVKSQIMRTIYA